MAHFEYSGRDTSGALVSGSIDAGSADDVAAQLFGDRVTPIEIREIGSSQKPIDWPEPHVLEKDSGQKVHAHEKEWVL